MLDPSQSGQLLRIVIVEPLLMAPREFYPTGLRALDSDSVRGRCGKRAELRIPTGPAEPVKNDARCVNAQLDSARHSSMLPRLAFGRTGGRWRGPLAPEGGAFIAKFTADGAPSWSRAITGSGTRTIGA